MALLGALRRLRPTVASRNDADLRRGRGRGAGAPPTVLPRAEALVEVPGVEPGSSELSAGLLRAQPMERSRAAAPIGDERRPQPRCDVPPGHGARPGGEPLFMAPLSDRVA